MVSISWPHDPPTSASQSAGITGMNHHARLFLFLRQGLVLSPRLECSGTIMARCSLDLSGSNHPPTSASWVAGTTDMHLDDRLSFKFFYWDEVSLCCPGCSWTSGSSNSPASASQSAGITGMSHHAQPVHQVFWSKHYSDRPDCIRSISLVLHLL